MLQHEINSGTSLDLPCLIFSTRFSDVTGDLGPPLVCDSLAYQVNQEFLVVEGQSLYDF